MQRTIILAIVIALLSSLVLAISVLAADHHAGCDSAGGVILASQSPKPASARETPMLAPAPKPDWLSDLIEAIKAAGGGTGTAKAIVDDDPVARAAELEAELDNVENVIDQIQGSAYPDLSPANAGQPGSSRTFITLEEVADQVAQWGQDAEDAIEKHIPPTSGDHAAAGYALDSIKRALPQYRDLADL